MFFLCGGGDDVYTCIGDRCIRGKSKPFLLLRFSLSLLLYILVTLNKEEEVVFHSKNRFTFLCDLFIK